MQKCCRTRKRNCSESYDCSLRNLLCLSLSFKLTNTKERSSVSISQCNHAQRKPVVSGRSGFDMVRSASRIDQLHGSIYIFTTHNWSIMEQIITITLEKAPIRIFFTSVRYNLVTRSLYLNKNGFMFVPSSVGHLHRFTLSRL